MLAVGWLLLPLAVVPRPNRSAKGSSAAAAAAPASLLVLLGGCTLEGVLLPGGGGKMPGLTALCAVGAKNSTPPLQPDACAWSMCMLDLVRAAFGKLQPALQSTRQNTWQDAVLTPDWERLREGMEREVAKGVLSVLPPPKLPGLPNRRLCGCGEGSTIGVAQMCCTSARCRRQPFLMRLLHNLLSLLASHAAYAQPFCSA